VAWLKPRTKQDGSIQYTGMYRDIKNRGNWIGPRLRAGGPGLQSVWWVGVSVLVSGMGL